MRKPTISGIVKIFINLNASTMAFQVTNKGCKAALGSCLKFPKFCSASTKSISTATLPDLPYDYDALSPVIIPEIMELHHKKHHQAYVNGLNAALEKADDASNKNDLKTVISLQPAIKFNGGGKHYWITSLL